MSSELPIPSSEEPKATNGRAPALAGDPRTRAASAHKGAATIRRHKEEQRADRLDEIRGQIANGSLVVRQMTEAEHTAALHLATDARARNEARRTLIRALQRDGPGSSFP
jgi:hypothetical protein